jgi:hypothetical protein
VCAGADNLTWLGEASAPRLWLIGRLEDEDDQQDDDDE